MRPNPAPLKAIGILLYSLLLFCAIPALRADTSAKAAHAAHASAKAKTARSARGSAKASSRATRATASRTASAAARTTTSSRRRARFSYSFGPDPAKDDITTYDDPVVRSVAVEALGREKGSVLAVDPTSGRILTIVNQKMAFNAALEPCSTIKPFVAIAGLQEGVITRDTMIQVKRHRYMSLTEAMAHSNNEYFQNVGSQLGFDRVIHYDHMLGLGQHVGYDIPEEQSGSLPSSPPIFGGVARMSSFGEGIRMTPFQLASLVTTLANGGTQYYLQYPRSAQDQAGFEPRVRQQLDIATVLPDLREGMLAAVMYGTARQSFDPYGEQALGKTGTCNDENLGGRLGWFASYADQAHPKIVLVVLLHGGSRVISGPHASEIAGKIYRGLYSRNYFAELDRKRLQLEASLRAEGQAASSSAAALAPLSLGVAATAGAQPQ